MIDANLSDLAVVHPNLTWTDIRLAAIAVFTSRLHESPVEFSFSLSEIPGFNDNTLTLLIHFGQFSANDVKAIQRTYDAARLVELAALAMAGLVLYHAGEHRFVDIAQRGTAADYIIDDEEYLLEVAGRSRRRDLAAVWDEKIHRLSRNRNNGFLVCVAEFETNTARISFYS